MLTIENEVYKIYRHLIEFLYIMTYGEKNRLLFILIMLRYFENIMKFVCISEAQRTKTRLLLNMIQSIYHSFTGLDKKNYIFCCCSNPLRKLFPAYFNDVLLQLYKNFYTLWRFTIRYLLNTIRTIKCFAHLPEHTYSFGYSLRAINAENGCLVMICIFN